MLEGEGGWAGKKHGLPLAMLEQREIEENRSRLERERGVFGNHRSILSRSFNRAIDSFRFLPFFRIYLDLVMQGGRWEIG